MIKPDIKYCPGTLSEGFNDFGPSCLRNMFFGKIVSCFLPYDSPRVHGKDEENFFDNRKRISISGVQEKFSFLLEKNKLRLTNAGEQGSYILKPIPRDIMKIDQVPANEHLTMQIAKQVFRMEVAENALVFFNNGEPAYLTKRFDVKVDGNKWGKEDFASLSGKSLDNSGFNFKYEYSYEEMAILIHKYVPAWRIEIEKFYSLIIFNFIFSNGDAHLKNFSLLETPDGDYRLSPAYDLLNSYIHVNDTDFALDRGLFEEGMKSPLLDHNQKPTRISFLEFAKRIGVKKDRASKIIELFIQRQPKVEEFVQRSFLDESTKREYLFLYNQKRNQLNK
ncbi:MAG TPA: HipA domain-containing protein [Bacteroidales bacterium]|nr:HipA domain-containing protein [Bacteroidales bacterium]